MPCICVTFGHVRSTNRPEIQLNGTQFCAFCPDNLFLPADCPATCDPHQFNFAPCKMHRTCPCYMPYSQPRLHAFAQWLLKRANAMVHHRQTC